MLNGPMQAFPRKLMNGTDFKWKISIVDEHVDRREILPSCADHRFNLILLGYIGLKNYAATAAVYDVLQYLFSGLAVLMIIDDDGRAALRKSPSRSRADTAARPGNEDDFAVKRLLESLRCHGLALGQMATASWDAPFPYFAAFSLTERNFILT